jgi:hypothetical protein
MMLMMLEGKSESMHGDTDRDEEEPSPSGIAKKNKIRFTRLRDFLC